MWCLRSKETSRELHFWALWNTWHRINIYFYLLFFFFLFFGKYLFIFILHFISFMFCCWCSSSTFYSIKKFIKFIAWHHCFANENRSKHDFQRTLTINERKREMRWEFTVLKKSIVNSISCKGFRKIRIIYELFWVIPCRICFQIQVNIILLVSHRKSVCETHFQNLNNDPHS